MEERRAKYNPTLHILEPASESECDRRFKFGTGIKE